MSGLGQILAEGMEKRFARHQALGTACQNAIAALGLGQVPVDRQHAAHTMTAPRYPRGVSGADLLPRIGAAGATVAGGLHPAIRNEYFRIGHMGPTNMGDLLATIGALEAGLRGCEYEFQLGAGWRRSAPAAEPGAGSDEGADRSGTIDQGLQAASPAEVSTPACDLCLRNP